MPVAYPLIPSRHNTHTPSTYLPSYDSYPAKVLRVKDLDRIRSVIAIFRSLMATTVTK